MDAKTLYIIGNGFDKQHGIPSDYLDFKAFVELHDDDVFGWVEEFVPAGEDWAHLETALAELDTGSIIESLEHFMPSYSSDEWSDSGHHDFQYEVERVASGLSSRLQTLFAEWIRGLPIPDAASAPVRFGSLDSQGFYLTFNYTPTLSVVYEIDDSRILHIHGRGDDENADLILGHGWAPSERQSLNHSSDLETQDTRLTEALDELDSYFEKTFKPSQKIIAENADFFERLDSVEEVVVLGHGLSKVDQMYFKAIVKGLKDRGVIWTVAVRSPDSYEKNRLALLGFGVPSEQVFWKLWSDM